MKTTIGFLALAFLVPDVAYAGEGDKVMVFIDGDCIATGGDPESGTYTTSAPRLTRVCTVSAADASMICKDVTGDSQDLSFVIDKQATDTKKSILIWRESKGRGIVYVSKGTDYVWTQTYVVAGIGITHKQCTGAIVKK